MQLFVGVVPPLPVESEKKTCIGKPFSAPGGWYSSICFHQQNIPEFSTWSLAYTMDGVCTVRYVTLVGLLLKYIRGTKKKKKHANIFYDA